MCLPLDVGACSCIRSELRARRKTTGRSWGSRIILPVAFHRRHAASCVDSAGLNVAVITLSVFILLSNVVDGKALEKGELGFHAQLAFCSKRDGMLQYSTRRDPILRRTGKEESGRDNRGTEPKSRHERARVSSIFLVGMVKPTAHLPNGMATVVASDI